ncbi:hypothetical protein NC652_007845 [Populus alba x Populus x berolinensis]|nr:hypothetical protein NC652_007845 [Populus alba x Populus x berolinensis]
MSAIDVKKSLLANALLDFSNEWFLLLSESSIQVYKFHHHVCISHAIKTQLCGVFSELSTDGRGRYFHQMILEIQLHQWRKESLMNSTKLEACVCNQNSSKGLNKRLMKHPLYILVIQGGVILKREGMIRSKEGLNKKIQILV